MAAIMEGSQIQVNCLHTAIASTLLQLNGAAPSLPAANEGFEAVSTDNTNDKAAGNGALTIGIDYLDQTGAPHNDDITLNGTTAVPSANSNYWRINDAYVRTAGSTGVNAGTITGRKVSAGGNRFVIEIGRSVAAMGQFTVPLGYEATFIGGTFSGGVISGALSPLRLLVVIEAEQDRRNGAYNPGVWSTVIRGTNGLARPIELMPPRNVFFTFPALCTIRARAVTESATSIEVAGSFWLTLRATS